jgi:hypothetical protein
MEMLSRLDWGKRQYATMRWYQSSARQHAEPSFQQIPFCEARFPVRASDELIVAACAA